MYVQVRQAPRIQHCALTQASSLCYLRSQGSSFALNMADEEEAFEQFSASIQQTLWSDVVGTLEKLNSGLNILIKGMAISYHSLVRLNLYVSNSGFNTCIIFFLNFKICASLNPYHSCHSCHSCHPCHSA